MNVLYVSHFRSQRRRHEDEGTAWNSWTEGDGCFHVCWLRRHCLWTPNRYLIPSYSVYILGTNFDTSQHYNTVMAKVAVIILCEEKNYFPGLFNNMIPGDLATQQKTKVFNYLSWNIPVAAPQLLMWCCYVTEVKWSNHACLYEKYISMCCVWVYCVSVYWLPTIEQNQCSCRDMNASTTTYYYVWWHLHYM